MDAPPIAGSSEEEDKQTGDNNLDKVVRKLHNFKLDTAMKKIRDLEERRKAYYTLRARLCKMRAQEIAKPNCGKPKIETNNAKYTILPRLTPE